MATDTLPPIPEAEGDLGDESADTEGKSGKLKWIIIIAVVMLAEAGLMYFLIGGGGDADGDAAETEVEETQEDSFVEVPMEKLTCTNSQAAPGTTIHITIEIAALVESGQETEFEQALTKSHKARIREATLRVLRSANLEDLSDPNHGTIKRLIREQINKVLRKSVVREIAVSDYTKNEI